MRTKISRLFFLMLLLAASPVMAAAPSPEARRHMVRGIAAVEMAKGDADLALAADEFRSATNLDSTLAAAWYNLGAVQVKLGQFDAAIQSYKSYLKLAPNAQDTQKIEDEIIKLEFRQEQVTKSKAREGFWIASDGTYYLLKDAGKRITLVANEHRISDNEAISTTNPSTYVGDHAIFEKEQLSFNLDATSSKLAGTWTHTAITVQTCSLPEESGDVTGEFRDAEGAMVLRYVRTKFRALWNINLFTSERYCVNVTPLKKLEVETTLRGPVPNGNISIPTKGLHLYVEKGLFGGYKIGWGGDLKAGEIPQNSAHYAAIRIKCAIINELRQWDHLSRVYRQRVKQLEET
ncbi:MAG: hypothetical protein KJ702_01875, partial [Gammaproteobacteria bacterium]|nr:hypothetical protein [Gammaproteobacteria bacterium]